MLALQVVSKQNSLKIVSFSDKIICQFTGAVCGVYAGGRSFFTLFDRKKHEQSIGLGSKESRGAYFNIGGGVLCGNYLK